MKLAIHWQILIALVLGVVCGYWFAPTYTVSNNTIEKIQKENLPASLLDTLQSLQGIEYTDRKQLEAAISKQCGSSESAEVYLPVIMKQIQQNKYGGGSTYTLSAHSLKSLRQYNVPDDVLAKSKSMINKTFRSDRQYNKELAAVLGAENASLYKTRYIKAADKGGYVQYFAWIGDLFMRALRMIIVPLLITSITAGVANMGNAQNLGRLGLKVAGFYATTNILAIFTGLLFVNLIQPGVGIDLGLKSDVEGMWETPDPLGTLLVKIIPSNIFDAMVRADSLAIIFFCMLFGFFITRLEGSGREFMTTFFNRSTDIMMSMTEFIIKFAPIGVFGVVVKVVSDHASNLLELASTMSAYMLTVLISLAIHIFITLPLLVRFLGKAHPYKLFAKLGTTLLTAFSTASSAAALSLSMEQLENKVGVSKKITNFSMPLGATINMDGTALYECIAVIFIAQAYGVDLSFGEQLIVVVTSFLAAVGAAAVPMAGLVMMSIVLTAVGLPLEGVGLILAVDRILDMSRTTLNVWSDCCGAVIVAKSEKEKLTV